MIIYVVTAGSYSDYHIEAVFTDKEEATRWAKEAKAEVEELDSEIHCREIMRMYWLATINKNGEQINKNYQSQEMALTTLRGNGGITRLYGEVHFRGKSYESQEHAVKLAIEARQEWLRNELSKSENR